MTVTDREPPAAPGWPRRAARLAWPAAGAALLLGVAVSLLLPAGRHQWALSLIRQPARYTALSFTRPAGLPEVIGRRQSVTVAFAVTNHQGRPVTYRYVVSAASRRGTRQLARARAVVASGATWPVTVRVRPRCAASPCRVTVALPGHPETIDFLVTVRPRRQASRARAGPGRPR